MASPKGNQERDDSAPTDVATGRVLLSVVDDLMSEAVFRDPSGLCDPNEVSYEDRVSAAALREYAERLRNHPAARAALNDIHSRQSETSTTSYENLRPRIAAEVEHWLSQVDMTGRRDPDDLAHRVTALMLPMMVRRDIALETAHETLATVQRQRDTLINKVREAGYADLVPPWLLTERQMDSLAAQALGGMKGDDHG